ncbi:transforming growth factor beta activator LRRC33 [Lepisosteus oculatus]|uniref:transforming growth factor beta activator LRRC33 n=1 Tax=Lepisosteus oculatus TaxID=7918 RepID=UPI0035F50DCC
MPVLHYILCLLCLTLGQHWNILTSASIYPHHVCCKLVQRTAVCSGCQSSGVPLDLPENIEELRLNDNHISVLRNNTLTPYTHLKILSCARSSLEAVEPGVFTSASRIENLNFAKNNLRSGFQQTGQALRLLSGLRILDLTQNGLTEDMASFLLQNLTSLEYLSLSRNLLLRLDQSIFSSLHQLRELNLERNMLFEIEDGAFHSLQKLQRLNMAFNLLPCIANFGLTQLVVLNLSHNSIEWFISIPDMDEIFQLETLDLSDNKLFFFPFLPNRSRLRNLMLSNNMLSFYEHLTNNNSLDWPTTVQFYNLNSNVTNVTTAKLWDESFYSVTSSLDLLDLSRNQVRYLPPGFLNKMPSLSRLRLGKNCLESWDLTSEEIPASLYELDLSNNLLTELRANQSFLHVLPNLTHLNLSSNHLQRIPPRVFTGLRSLTTVDLSYNKVGICSMEKESTDYSNCAVWRNLSSLRHLYLLECDLQKIPPWAFQKTPITHLELSNNPEFLLEQDTLLELSTTVQHLGLGNTKMKHLDFTPCRNLRSLDISRNVLNHLPDSILRLSLKWLNLRDNKLSTIPVDQARTLSHTVQTLLLGGNPFNCCHLAWWTIFQETGGINIEDRTEVSCLHSTPQIHKVEHLDPHMCGNNSEEPTWVYILLFLPVCLSLLGICTVFYLSFKPTLLPKVIKERCWRPTPY